MSPDLSIWQRVVLPTEHGGWAFLAEPMLLGLLVAPSLAGALLALAALAAFLSRQPLRTVLLDRRRGKRHPRTRVAERALSLGLVVAASGLAGAALRTEGPLWLPLLLIAPLAATAVAFDVALRPRALAAELAGALAAGGLAAAIAIAGGWPLAPAFGLWGVLAARAAPSILYVRARLRLERGVAIRRGPPIVAGLLGVLAAAGLAREGLAPWLSVGALGLLALRALHGLSRFRLRMRTWVLGLTEITFGLVTVLSVVLGMAFERQPERALYLVWSEPIIRSKSPAAPSIVAWGPVSLKNTSP
jgi:hypothetical protein